MQRYKNTVHTRSLLQSEADRSICNFYPSSPRGEIKWWDFIYTLTADIFPSHGSKPWSSLKKKDEINLLDLSMWWPLLVAAGSCTVHIKTVFHSKVTQISLLKTLSIPACKARSLRFTRPLFCRPLCFGQRWGGGESSCWWGVPTVEIRKCQDFTVMNFPHGASCLVNAKSERDARPEWPGQGSQQGPTCY